ncbi:MULTISPECIES: LysR family transcriptional regulator [Prauserella]|uniref:LysR family transcriptional regulator n=1 Tax=Prauserella endophytica TaxID=1592324 RepID=A0ABY2RWK5_9PSEU|nr:MULTISPECIES: LysR family transcriptional regulator [Prauserella]TKG63559.1 LysR family transcriptional regulator [Prauserella endophytica]
MATHESLETFDLVVFLTVARAGSFGTAARELRLATPSVSARIATLEHKLTTQLFARTARGSTLTPAGERLVPYARRCLDLLGEAHQAVGTEASSRLILAAPASLGTELFPPVLKILSDSSLQAHCRVAHSREVIDLLLDGTADIGLVINQAFPASITAHNLCRSRLLTVSHPRHPLAEQPSVSIDALSTSRIAVYRWNPDADILAEIFEYPRRPPERPVQLLGLPSVAIELAIKQDYVAIIPEFAAVDSLRAGTIVELSLTLPRWSLDVQLAYRREAAQTNAVKTLLANADAIAAGIQQD